jgi:hypothetical protein
MADSEIAGAMRPIDETIVELEQAGFTPQDRMRISFRFEAPTMRAAVELADALRMGGHNRVQVRPDPLRVLSGRRWRVTVTTPPTPVMREAMELWAERMLDVAHGNDACEITGWRPLINYVPMP